jgi:hypothetical protein
MKTIGMLFLLVLPCVAMSQSKKSSSAPFKATYSSNFKMGDPKYSQQVLVLWKDYEQNTLDKHSSWFADTASIAFADGKITKGRANLIAGAKAARGAVKNYKCTIAAYMSLISVDKKKQWVAIWGTDEYTDKNGKAVKVNLQEIWGFNKDGKIDYMSQYAAK